MERIERYRGCLLGLAVGDAVGTTLEFKSPGTFKPITDMVVRRDLEEYCGLDTLGMVQIVDQLKRLDKLTAVIEAYSRRFFGY